MWKKNLFLSRLLASTDRYYITGNACAKLTDAEENISKTKWVTDNRYLTKNGGPYFYIHLNYACPNCNFKKQQKNNPCCKNVPQGQFCQADSVNIEDDPNVNRNIGLLNYS